MLEQAFTDIYTKFKMHFYETISKRSIDQEGYLTTSEAFCMEGIIALGEPTVAQFGNLMNLSTPNAAYKVNNLIKKGYLEKIQSTQDRREYHLRPTKKYMDFYNISYAYLHTVVERAEAKFSKDDIEHLEEILKFISDELMPEIELPR